MSADTIITNGRLYTVDPQRRWAQALAIKDGVIVAVGSELEVAAHGGPGTQVVDLRGAMVLAGIGDVHNHHPRGGQAEL